MVMAIPTLLAWWYTEGWRVISREAGARVVRVSHLFSLPILIRTLWAPWRRITTTPGAGLDAKVRALGDNMVSRVIGFSVRGLVLIAAGLILLLVGCYGVLMIAVWPFVPLAIPVLIVKAAIG